MSTTTVTPDLTPVADVKRTIDGFTVWVTYPHAGVDRPVTSGWSTGYDEHLAGRLAAAVNAGAATGPAEVLTDVHGETYVGASHVVSGRTLNADLRRLGF